MRITAYQQLGTASLDHPRVWSHDLVRFPLIFSMDLLFSRFDFSHDPYLPLFLCCAQFTLLISISFLEVEVITGFSNIVYRNLIRPL